MNQFRRLILGICAGVLLLPGATMNFGSELAPEAPGATGSGYVSVIYDDVARTLSIDADWTGLSGITTVAHIHCCTAVPGAGTVGVAVTPGTLPGFPGSGSGTTGVSAGVYNTVINLALVSSYTAGFRTGLEADDDEGAEARLIAGILAGQAYFNIHSSTFGSGEIRGFLAPVPEPGTLVLSGLGIVALLGIRRLGTRMGKA